MGSVLVFTNRPEFEAHWSPILQDASVDAHFMDPSELTASVGRRTAVIIDGQYEGCDEDELLACAGFSRAVGAIPAVSLPPAATTPAVEQVLEDICQGLVAHGDKEAERIVSSLARRLEVAEHRRFEYVTVAPNEKDVLAVFGNGDSVLLERPLSGEDSMSEITNIALDASSTTARISLADGKSLKVSVDHIRPRRRASDSGDQPRSTKQYIKGSELGARLKQLRTSAGLTQAELARRTGIHRPNIARVEAGRHTPSLETLSKLAAAIGVPTTRIFSDA